ncbi:MAG: hypothetical protein HF982_07195 [Desulfobacteraceae bacterium]|nr:hypothetical protein [Desulfobacteraceae bacterium]MBC2719357.1 hypothetical protein [Desulfobacteraceae bacterium]
MLIIIPIVNYSKQLQCTVVKRLNYPYGFVKNQGILFAGKYFNRKKVGLANRLKSVLVKLYESVSEMF